jgi:hypothetical protein
VKIENIIYIQQSDKAICIKQGIRGEEVWIPKSQIDGSFLDKNPDRPEDRRLSGWIEIPGWLAEKKGLL